MKRVDATSDLAFIGLGSMGKPISNRLIENGFHLKLYSRSLKSDFTQSIYSSPSEVVKQCSVLLLCLTNDEAVENVLFGPNGAINNLEQDSYVIDLSTISPVKAIDFAQKLNSHGVNYLDCPVSGGTEGAKNGSLSIFVGGKKNAFEAVSPILNVIGKTIYYFGDIGKGQQVKAINQILVAGTYAAVAEAISLAKNLNLPMDKLKAALSKGAGNSWALENRTENMVYDNYPLGFRLSLHHKDLSIAISIANENNIELPITSHVKYIEEVLINRGLGDFDVSIMHKYTN